MTIDLRLGRWQDVLQDVEPDCLIVDAPYSAKTHVGHNYTHAINGGKVGRSTIDYAHFEPADVNAFVESWAPRTRGWFVTITDDVLAPVWADALRIAGRYVFAPLPYVAVGSRCRLNGDGPSSWSVWIVVARPSAKPYSAWGTLPGAYVLPPGHNDRKDGAAHVVGGKPLWLMRALVRDYSLPGDLVCDPCAGGSTTLIAAAMEGRRAVGAECMPEHYEIARKRIARGYTPSMFTDVPAPAAEQTRLFDEKE
jgi:site-specific DNA-methyltransferase (adenine-specific)